MAKQPKTTTQPTPQVSKPKTQTLGEFKAWLSGVEEMQAENWAPDLTQWRRIRERIENIVETRTRVAAPVSEYSLSDEPPPPPQYVRPSGPSLLTAGPVGPSAPPTFMTADPNQRARAPNIDTSSQPYASGLE